MFSSTDIRFSRQKACLSKAERWWDVNRSPSIAGYAGVEQVIRKNTLHFSRQAGSPWKGINFHCIILLRGTCGKMLQRYHIRLTKAKRASGTQFSEAGVTGFMKSLSCLSVSLMNATTLKK